MLSLCHPDVLRDAALAPLTELLCIERCVGLLRSVLMSLVTFFSIDVLSSASIRYRGCASR